jgi:hypothetical protein
MQTHKSRRPQARASQATGIVSTHRGATRGASRRQLCAAVSMHSSRQTSRGVLVAASGAGCARWNCGIVISGERLRYCVFESLSREYVRSPWMGKEREGSRRDMRRHDIYGSCWAAPAAERVRLSFDSTGKGGGLRRRVGPAAGGRSAAGEACNDPCFFGWLRHFLSAQR